MNPKPRRTPHRLLEVVRTQQITPQLIRITLGGPQLYGFPQQSYGAHIKIFLPRAHQNQPQLPKLTSEGIIWPPSSEKPITRAYSVREYRPIENELDIEFVLHGIGNNQGCGPAANWAHRAKIGDRIGVAGPGGPSPLLPPADWHLLGGDLTALPAISAILAHLPAHSRGYAFIETDNQRDRTLVKHPRGIKLHWLLRKPKAEILLESMQSVSPPIGTTSISAFIAGENTAVVTTRDYLRDTYGLTKKNLYAVPYWRRGQTEEDYHEQRHRVMDEVY